MDDKIAKLNADTRAEHECSMAAINAVLVRCRQNNRMFFTAEDARASDIIKRTLLSLQAVDPGVREGAPQTMPSHVHVPAFAAVESVLRESAPDGDVKVIA